MNTILHIILNICSLEIYTGNCWKDHDWAKLFLRNQPHRKVMYGGGELNLRCRSSTENSRPILHAFTRTIRSTSVRCKHVLRRIRNSWTPRYDNCKILLSRKYVWTRKQKLLLLITWASSRWLWLYDALFLFCMPPQVTMTSHQSSTRICQLRVSFLKFLGGLREKHLICLNQNTLDICSVLT